MTAALSGTEMAAELEQQFPGSIVESSEESIIVKSDSLLKIAFFLKTASDLCFDYLTSVTATDLRQFVEVSYHLTSTVNNHSLVLKVRIGRGDNPTTPSVVSIWRGADLQEREIYDLMGISFNGHPNLKRIFLWEGFEGYPLRRDYL